MKDFETQVHDYRALEAARRYLKAEGWISYDKYWDDIVVFRRPEEENRPYDEIVLPKIVNASFGLHLKEAARRLALWSNQTEESCLFRMLNPDVDRIRCRLDSPELELGTTPMFMIQGFVDSVIDVLKAAVLDVAKPELWHKRLRSADIDKMMRQAKFGQTERGSFVLNLFIPIQDADESNQFEETRSRLWRRGVVHLTTVLNDAISAIESGTPESFENNNKESRQTSANLIEAIDAAVIGDDASLELSVDWAPTLPVDESTPSIVVIKKSYSNSFHEWARSFRPVERDREKARFVATIRSLQGSQRDDSDRPYGEVSLWIFNQDEEKNYEAKAFLNADQYDEALNAHKGNNYVSFDGICQWNGSKARLESIENLRIVDSVLREPSTPS